MFSKIKVLDRYASMTKKPVLLVDTDILSDICKGGESENIEKELFKKGVTLLYSLTSIMELGFGPTSLVSEKEKNYYKELYRRKSPLRKDIFVADFSWTFENGHLDEHKGKWICVSPDSHNWYAAKKTMVSYMDAQKTRPKNAKGLQTDILLSCMAWNAGAFIWTNNVKDHIIATYYMTHLECTRNRKHLSKESLECLAKHMSPVFNTNTLSKILDGHQINIYTEMKKKTKNREILNVLSIAEQKIQ